MSYPLINISRKQALRFASFLVLYQFLTYIANDMIMPGMIHVVANFHGKETDIATSLTAYVLGGASLQIFLGPLSDSFGRRPVMLWGALLFLICTVFIASSNSMFQFLLARYFQGMGLCFIGVVGYATLQEIFAEMDAIRLISVLSNVASLAPLLGPLAGATFILYFSWRVIFLVIGALALVAWWGLWYFMPEPIGAIKNDGQIIARVSLAPSVVMRNYRQLLFNHRFMIGALASGLMGIPCIAWIAISPIIIVTDAQLTVIDYALWQLPMFSAGIIGNWYLSRLTRTKTINQLILKGSFFTCLGLVLVWVIPLLTNSHFIWLVPGLSVYGFGMGIATAPLLRLTLFLTPVSKGTAYAMISMLSMMLQALGVELANKVYTYHNNIYFGGYCTLVGLMYFLGVGTLFVLTKQVNQSLKVTVSSS